MVLVLPGAWSKGRCTSGLGADLSQALQLPWCRVRARGPLLWPLAVPALLSRPHLPVPGARGPSSLAPSLFPTHSWQSFRP